MQHTVTKVNSHFVKRNHLRRWSVCSHYNTIGMLTTSCLSTCASQLQAVYLSLSFHTLVL